MSKTMENLAAAFAGESQARNMYGFFAEVARKEGYHYVAKILEETAANERRHANLKAAMEGEDYETTSMYPEFAAAAKAEGNTEAMVLFEQIAKVEAHHRDRYARLLEMVEAGTVYERDEPVEWKCAVCGYVHEGTTPPEKCPCCKHGKEHYEPSDMSII